MVHTHTHTYTSRPHGKTLQKLPHPELSQSTLPPISLQLSIQLSVLARKTSLDSEFAALSFVRGSTCDICTDMLEIILHVIVRQIGGQQRCRQGNVARDIEEMFNHGPAHSGASLFSLSSLRFISFFTLSLSLSLPTAAGLPLGESCIMAGLIY